MVFSWYLLRWLTLLRVTYVWLGVECAAHCFFLWRSCCGLCYARFPTSLGRQPLPRWRFSYSFRLCIHLIPQTPRLHPTVIPTSWRGLIEIPLLEQIFFFFLYHLLFSARRVSPLVLLQTIIGFTFCLIFFPVVLRTNLFPSSSSFLETLINVPSHSVAFVFRVFFIRLLLFTFILPRRFYHNFNWRP